MGRLAGRRMWGRTSRLALAGLCCLCFAHSALAVCLSADLNGDCFIDLQDFALLAAEWPTTDFNDIAEITAHWLTPDPRVPDDMAYVPVGTFEMGDNFGEGWDKEKPVHTVWLDSFYMGNYEITNQQYCAFLNWADDNGWITVSAGVVYPGSGTSYPYCSTSSAPSGGPIDGRYSQIAYSDGVFSVRTKGGRNMSNDPMVMVCWYGAVAYCNWRSQQEGKEPCYNLSTWNCDFSKKGYRLATEAEWEYAARGGLADRRFPWGDTISQTQANFYSYPCFYDISPVRNIYHPLWNDGIYPYTSPVGFFDGTMKYRRDYHWPGSAASYQTTSGANDYGLYDMAGNAVDWCNDWHSSSYYSSSPTNNPPGPGSGTSRVIRGGSWKRDARYCRIAYRYGYTPTNRSSDLGFRLVLDF